MDQETRRILQCVNSDPRNPLVRLMASAWSLGFRHRMMNKPCEPPYKTQTKRDYETGYEFAGELLADAEEGP